MLAEPNGAALTVLLRQLPTADRYVRDGSWQQAPSRMNTGLAGKRVGIVSLVRIGKGIVRGLEPFGVTLAYTGSAPQQVPYEFFATTMALAGFADILIVSCRSGEATRNLIGASANGFLINAVRGSMVDDATLIAALESHTIRGASCLITSAACWPARRH